MRARTRARVRASQPSVIRTESLLMSKSHDAKKNVKKAPTRTPKEKKEAKRLKKAERKF